MARRKKVEEKNYEELITISEERIISLTQELKDEKINLKQLKKDKERYDEIKAEKEKEEQLQRIAEMVIASGKPLKEIEEMLGK